MTAPAVARMEQPLTYRRTLLTDHQRRTLVDLVWALRPEWEPAAITAHVRAAEQVGVTAADVAAACVTSAATPEHRTPALMGTPGRHWPGESAEVVRARTRDYAIACSDHAGEPMPCRRCADETRPPTAADLARLREAVRRAGG